MKFRKKRGGAEWHSAEGYVIKASERAFAPYGINDPEGHRIGATSQLQRAIEMARKHADGTWLDHLKKGAQ